MFGKAAALATGDTREGEARAGGEGDGDPGGGVGRPSSADAIQGLWWAGLGGEEDVSLSAITNSCISQVYSCNVRDGVENIERMVQRDPRRFMRSVVVFNLCTLYDLSFDNPTSTLKKKVLMAVAQRYHLDDIDPTCFRTG
ncbi:unnamed protein product [Discosporangium mesarthrocarpum]